MKLFTYFLLAFLLAGALPVIGEEEWPSDLPKALVESKEADRPVLVYFTAPWCGPCRLMKRTTLSDLRVNESLGSFIKVVLDYDNNPELAKQFGIQGIPAFVVLSSEGEPVQKNIGYMDATQFERWLTDSVAAAAFAAGQKKVFEENVAKLEKSLASSNKEQRAKAIQMLFDFCASSERADREYGIKKIKELGEAYPQLLVGGLTHERLAVRIAVSKLLHEKFGEKFQFDPWLPQPERLEAALKVREQFSKNDDPVK